MFDPVFAFINGIGAPEILLILVIVLILFGAKRLPELARGLGQSMNEFRKAREDFETELHKSGQPAPSAELRESAKSPEEDKKA